mmetsp:Transcript_17503/g.49032  ORF Transcript_17503/g.49032 Transcript_17503/m.49032 type:complete len:201 (-) Transcript_17503:1385-1987(-)
MGRRGGGEKKTELEVSVSKGIPARRTRHRKNYMQDIRLAAFVNMLQPFHLRMCDHPSGGHERMHAHRHNTLMTWMCGAWRVRRRGQPITPMPKFPHPNLIHRSKNVRICTFACTSPSLLSTGSRPWWRGSRNGVEYGCGPHAPLKKSATEVLQAPKCVDRMDGRLDWTPQSLCNGSEPRPNGLFEVRRVDGFTPHLAVST